MTNRDDLINTIELMKQSLLFYADEINYESKHQMNGELFSKIEMDKGNQARFAIKKIDDLNKYMDDLENFDINSIEMDMTKIDDDYIKNLKKNF